MRKLDLPEARERFDALFSDAANLFKVEVLQDYTGVDDGPSLQAWLRGDHVESERLAADGLAAWRQKCAGKRIARVHVVEEPYTPYLEWEIEVVYRRSLLRYNTEEAYLVPTEDAAKLALPAGDVWIFDGHTALEWGYVPPSGPVAEGYITESSDEVERYLKLWGDIMGVAQPLLADEAA